MGQSASTEPRATSRRCRVRLLPGSTASDPRRGRRPVGHLPRPRNADEPAGTRRRDLTVVAFVGDVLTSFDLVTGLDEYRVLEHVPVDGREHLPVHLMVDHDPLTEPGRRTGINDHAICQRENRRTGRTGNVIALVVRTIRSAPPPRGQLTIRRTHRLRHRTCRDSLRHRRTWTTALRYAVRRLRLLRGRDEDHHENRKDQYQRRSESLFHASPSFPAVNPRLEARSWF